MGLRWRGEGRRLRAGRRALSAGWRPRLVLLFTALQACTAALPPSAVPPLPRERAAIEAAIQSWRVAGLPWSPTCRAELPRIQVVISGPAEFTELCGRAPVHGGGNLYACSTEQFEQSFPVFLLDNDQVPLLVISRLQPPAHRRLLVIHEAMHWLERCSGKGIDFDHEDPRVWETARLMAERMIRHGRGRYRLVERSVDAPGALARR